MSKYQPLEQRLEAIGNNYIPITFSEIEEILGFELPNSARSYRPWWSNNASSHVQARAWIEAGYVTERVDMEGENLVFRRDETLAAKEIKIQNGTHPLFGKLKGQITITVDFDLTDPTGAEWEATKE